MRSARRVSLVQVSASALLVLGAAAVAPSALAEDASSGLPAPSLTLSLAAGTGSAPWKIRVDNTGDVPVRIAADARALTLEVTPPPGTVLETPKAGAKKPAAKSTEPVIVKCELPADTRPSSDDGRELVVPSKRSWTTSFDPLFFCFGARERAALVSGAIVRARLGWAPPTPKAGTAAAKKAKVTPPAPPFFATPVGAAIGRVAPMKSLESASISLSETIRATPAAAPTATATATSTTTSATTGVATPEASRASSPGGLLVSTAETADAYRAAEIGITVTLTNESDRTVTTLFRPEMLRFSVSGPVGTVSCGSTRAVASPIRELYGSIGPKGKTSVTLLLTAVCPFDAFDEPGLYRVTPTFDSSAASGRTVGLRSWDGEATAATPLLLRVRNAKRPGAGGRPTLD